MENKKTKTCFNYNYLEKLCFEHDVILVDKFNKNDYITGKTIISGICKTNNCNNIFNKKFASLHENKIFLCHNCGQKNRLEKQAITNMEKYGVTNVFQSEEIKKQIKEKCLEKYGCEYYLQTKEKKEKSEKTCLEKYGKKIACQSVDVKNKRTETIINKYGVINVFQSEEIKEKIKETCLKKYGVEYASQTEDKKIRTANTCLQKYGVKTSLLTEHVKQKLKEKNMNDYGVENAFQSKEVQEKIKLINKEKYGFENPLQCPEIAEKMSKSSYSRKEYIFPSGKTELIQGYENIALDELLQKELVKEEDIVTGCKNVPEIWYNDEEGKKHRHFVDIFIPSQNKCIEVKSTWTAKKKESNIYLKQQAGKELGYEYEIWIYNGKGEKVETIK